MIDAEYLRLHLGGLASETGDSEVLLQCAEDALAHVERVTGRSFRAAAEVTELVDGNGEQEIELRNAVASGTPAVYYYSGGSWVELTGANLFTVERHPHLGVNNVLRLTSQRWPPGTRNVKVTYQAGYTGGAELAEIRMLVADLAARRFALRPVALRQGDDTGETGTPEHLAEILERWRYLQPSQPRLVVR